MKTQLCEIEISLLHFTTGKGGFATSSKFPQGTQLVNDGRKGGSRTIQIIPTRADSGGRMNHDANLLPSLF